MKSKVLKNSVFNLVYKLFNVIYPLITVSYASHILMSNGIGKVSFVQNIVSYFTLLAALGIPSYGIRLISRTKDKSDNNKAFSELFFINLISSLFFSLIYYFMIFTIDYFYNDILLYIICGLAIPLNILNVDWYYQGKEKYGYIVIRSIIVKLLSLVLLFLLVRNSTDLIFYTMISIIGICGNYIFNFVNLFKEVKIVISEINLKKHIKSVLILLISVIAGELYSKVDITMLGLMYDDSVVGCYSNAIKLINVIITCSTAITTVFLPRLSYLYENNIEEFNKLINIGTKIIIFFVIPISTGLVIIAPNLVIMLFGESFKNSISILRVLSVLIPVKAIGDLLCYQLIISINKEKYFIMFYGIAAIVNIMLNFILIPVWKGNGAAIASIISEIIVNFGLFFISRKYIKFDHMLQYIMKIVISNILMGIIVYLIYNVIENMYISIAFSTFIGVVTYFAMNFILKNNIFDLLKKRTENEK